MKTYNRATHFEGRQGPTCCHVLSTYIANVYVIQNYGKTSRKQTYMVPRVNDKLTNAQTGFSKNMSTVDQIARLQDTINKYIRNQGPCF